MSEIVQSNSAVEFDVNCFDIEISSFLACFCDLIHDFCVVVTGVMIVTVIVFVMLCI
jgi:hypothetical protein